MSSSASTRVTNCCSRLSHLKWTGIVAASALLCLLWSCWRVSDLPKRVLTVNLDSSTNAPGLAFVSISNCTGAILAYWPIVETRKANQWSGIPAGTSFPFMERHPLAPHQSTILRVVPPITADGWRVTIFAVEHPVTGPGAGFRDRLRDWQVGWLADLLEPKHDPEIVAGPEMPN